MFCKGFEVFNCLGNIKKIFILGNRILCMKLILLTILPVFLKEGIISMNIKKVFITAFVSVMAFVSVVSFTACGKGGDKKTDVE